MFHDKAYLSCLLQLYLMRHCTMELLHNQLPLNQSNIVKDMLSLYIFLATNVTIENCHNTWSDFSPTLWKQKLNVTSLWTILIHPYNLSAVLRMSIVILQNHKKIAIYSNNIMSLRVRSVGTRIMFLLHQNVVFWVGPTALDNPESLLHRNHILTLTIINNTTWILSPPPALPTHKKQ